MLQFHTFTLGEWQTNCYVVHRAGGSNCWIIDAGFDPQPMVRYIRQHQLTPMQVLLTHAHVDHIAGLVELRAHWPTLPILIHPAEREFLAEPMLNLSIVLDEPIVAPEATGTFEHGQTLDLDGLTLRVRHTPGHSPGGVTFYQPDAGTAFVGDTLFARSVGRTDFPTSDAAALMRSIREQLLTLPEDTRVLAGHGPPTTIGAERRGNPFL